MLQNRKDETVLEKEMPMDDFAWSSNMSFGSIPSDIIDHIRDNNDDWLIKLRCIEDLDAILDSFLDPINQSELNLLMNFSSSFI